MHEKFKIYLKASDIMPQDPQDKSVKKLKTILSELDPIALCSLYNIACHTRSVSIGLSVVHKHLSIEEAVRATMVEEDFQS